MQAAQFEETGQAQRRQLHNASVMEADSPRLELRSMHVQFNEHSVQQRSQLVALEGMLSHDEARDLAVREDAQVLRTESEQQSRMIQSAEQTWQSLRGEATASAHRENLHRSELGVANREIARARSAAQ